MGLAGGQLLGLLSDVVYMLTYPPQTKKSKKKAKKAKKTVQGPPATTSATESSAPNGAVTSSAAAPANETGSVTKRHLAPQVEDVEDE
jgi:hypothetical protein